MANLFRVTLADGMSKVNLDSKGCATAQYTVKNVSARPLDGRAVLASLPQTKPLSGIVEKGWVKIDGKADRHFDVDKEETFTVRICVPPQSPAGNYSFRLDAVWADQPDQGDSGGAIGFTVAPPQPTTGHFPLWLIPVLAVLVIGLGVGIWLLLRPHGIKVPDLKGQTVSQAVATLASAGLTLDQNNLQTVDSKPEDSGKILSQKPQSGQPASKDQQIEVTVGAPMVTVPQLVNQPFQAVSAILGEKKLTVGRTTTVQNAGYAPGVVTSQTPPPGAMVKAGTAVDLVATPQPLFMPNVQGLTLGTAILALKGLTVTSLSGDTTKTVLKQMPAPGTAMPVGGAVSLEFPIIYCGTLNCVYRGFVLNQLVLQHGNLAREVQQRGATPQN